MIKVSFVCYGNICRSPMAEYIFKDLLKKHHLENIITVNSRATSTEEIGSDIYPNTKAVLEKNSIPYSRHFATQITKEEYNDYDYIICMEETNIRRLNNIIGKDIENKVYKLLDFSPNPQDISDPWYHRNFDKTYNEISFGCKHLLNYLTQQL